MLRFLVPSLLGAFIFLFPVLLADRQTIVFGLITDALSSLLSSAQDEVLLGLLLLSALLTPLQYLLRNSAPGRHELMRRWFSARPAWIGLRLAGSLIAVAVYFDVGPASIRAADTGGTVFYDICMPVMLVYFAGTLFLGLLTDYGLMEFTGVLVQRPFQRLFRLPGSAAVDAIASFVAASGLGLILTIRQYENGRYSAREACVICCSFSVVSIPFSLVIAEVAGIPQLFFGWYVTLVVACIAAAMVIARIGPMAGKGEGRFAGAAAPLPPSTGRQNGKTFRRALDAAVMRSAAGARPATYLRMALLQCGDLLFGLLGPIMVVATSAAILVFHTPLFDIAARPLGHLLGAFGFPEAEAAAKGFVVGALDQFMPALVARGLDSEFARFVLAGLSVTQLVYLSEFALLLLRSPLPITLGDLLITFLLRTIVVTPFILTGAWLLV
ncbi:nucleoside recognition domain-containing protein [Pseudohaliea sp.]|uniref:YjiH family protein n=1 Tax=Pseudohaliea sp. TaxID=2740289 RepID=UPI0032EC011C